MSLTDLFKKFRRQRSFYDTEEEEAPLTGFYAGNDPLAEPEEELPEKQQGFRWWEWAIFIIEGLLILYTIGAFLGLVPPF